MVTVFGHTYTIVAKLLMISYRNKLCWMILFEYFELTKLRFGQTTKKTKEKIVVRLDDLDLLNVWKPTN